MKRCIPLTLTAIYALAGGVWIIFSNLAVHAIFSDPTHLSQAQTIKGWLYVLLTTTGLYLFLRYYTRQVRASQAALQQANQALEQRVTERTAELEDERNLLRTLVDALPDHIYIKDRDSRFIMINAGIVELFGIAALEEAIGKTDFDFFPRAYAERFHADEREIVRTGQPLANREEQSIDHAGNTYWVLTTKIPLCDAEGNVQRIVGIGRDISARKRMEDALRQARDHLEQRVAERTAELRAANAALRRSEEQLTLVLEGSSDGFWDWDLRTDTVQFSERWAEILGYELDEVAPTLDFWESRVHPADLPAVQQAIESHMTGHTPHYQTEHRMRARSGEWKWILDRGKVVTRDAGGQPVRMTGTHTDITARKRAEAARSAIENQYQVLFQQAYDAIMVLKDGLFMDCNPQAVEMFGGTRSDVIGKSPADFSPTRQPDGSPSFEAATAHISAALKGEPQFFEWRHRRIDGTLFDVEVTLNQVWVHGQVLIMAIVRDITARKQTEQTLRKANRAYRVLSDCNQAMIRASDDTALLREVSQVITQQGGYQMAWVGLVNGEESEPLRAVVQTGVETDFRLTPFSPTGPAVGVLRSGEPFIVQDVGATPSFAPWSQQVVALGCQSLVLLALRRDDETFGVLLVCAAEPDAFDSEEVALLNELAYDLAYGIDNLRTQRAREQAQAELRDVNAQLQRSNRELRAQTARLSRINHISARLAQTLDLEEIYRIALDELQDFLHVDYAGLALFEGDAAARLVLDTHSDDQQRTDVTLPLTDNPSIAAIKRTHKPIIAPDVLHNPLFEPVWDVLRRRGTHSLVVVPLLVGDDVIGTLGLDWTQPYTPSAVEMEVVETVANHVSVAIAKAQIYESERSQRTLAEALRDTAAAVSSSLDFDDVLHQILENIGRVVPHDSTTVMFLNDDGTASIAGYRGYDDPALQAFAATLRWPVQEVANLRQTRESGQALVIPDTGQYPGWIRVPETERINSHITLPIKREEQVIGFITLDSDTPGYFSEQHVKPLQAFVDQAAVAIQKARLFAAEREQRVLAEALRDTAAAVNSTLKFDEVLDYILDNVDRVAPHDVADVRLIEEGAVRVVRSRAAREVSGLMDWIDDYRFDLEGTANLRYMFESQQPLVIPDTETYPGWLKPPGSEWIRSHAGVPILHNDRVVGFIVVHSKQANFYSERHAERLQAFANQVAVAIRNARLYDDLERRAAELEALRQITLAITSQLDLDALLRSLVEQTVALLGGSVCGIYLYDADSDRLQWVTQIGHNLQPLGSQRQRGEGLAGTVLDTNAPLVVSDYQAWEGRAHQLDAMRILSSIGTPIRWGEEILGVLVVDSLAGDEAARIFEKNDAHLLGLLANQAAIAIKNAQLYEASHDYATQLEQRVQERTAELETQRAQLQTILDTMGEALIYTVGPEVKYVNDAYEQLFGFTADEVMAEAQGVYQQISKVIDDRQTQIASIQEPLRRGQVWRGEVKLQHKDGTRFDAALTLNRVPDTYGPNGPSGMVALFRDISQEKALQAQKDRFIASASHELRTPLANLKTRLYLARRQPERLEQHLAIVEKVTANMTALIENLLDVSRFERGIIPLQRAPVLLQDLIGDVVAIQRAEAERKQITLEAVLPAAPLVASVDRQRMEQVITNLVTNAINYTPEEGQVTVELARVDAADGPQALIHVRDTGLGIDPDTLHQIFEPFFRAHETAAQGTGLGLTIAREIVGLHHGQITVESQPGQGSVFTVALPLTD